jgi:hypothetical protein
MALHDLWHFENSPQGLNLSTAVYGTAYSANTIYNQYTGNLVGQPMSNASNTFQVTSDGFLSLVNNASGQAGALVVPLNAVQDWSVATQYWFGFRRKITVALGGAPWLILISNNTSYGAYTTLLTDAMMAAVNLNNVGVEYYIEVFMDRTALTFQVYCGNVLVNSGALNSSTTLSGAGYLSFGPIANGMAAGGAAGYRDFYFLDVDATTPGRLGALRAKATTVASVSGSEWVAQGAADIPTALNTAMTNPPTATPNALSPLDNQPLSIQMATTITDSGSKIVAVQPAATFQGGSGNLAKMNASFKDASSNTTALGQLVAASGLAVNQRLPFTTKAPDGTAWTAAKINQSQYVLTPTS